MLLAVALILRLLLLLLSLFPLMPIPALLPLLPVLRALRALSLLSSVLPALVPILSLLPLLLVASLCLILFARLMIKCWLSCKDFCRLVIVIVTACSLDHLRSPRSSQAVLIISGSLNHLRLVSIISGSLNQYQVSSIISGSIDHLRQSQSQSSQAVSIISDNQYHVPSSKHTVCVMCTAWTCGTHSHCVTGMTLNSATVSRVWRWTQPLCHGYDVELSHCVTGMTLNSATVSRVWRWTHQMCHGMTLNSSNVSCIWRWTQPTVSWVWRWTHPMCRVYDVEMQPLFHGYDVELIQCVVYMTLNLPDVSWRARCVWLKYGMPDRKSAEERLKDWEYVLGVWTETKRGRKRERER